MLLALPSVICRVVSYAEFRHGLSMLGFEPTDDVFEALLRLVDGDASGSIDYVEFAANLGLVDETAEEAEANVRLQVKQHAWLLSS